MVKGSMQRLDEIAIGMREGCLYPRGRESQAESKC